MLLTDLTLGYELLADDPIEVGIHYGKSILGALSESVTNASQTVEHVIRNTNSPRVVRAPRKESVRGMRSQTRTPNISSREVPYSSVRRGEIARRPVFAMQRAQSTPAFSRTLVGAM